MRNSLKNPYTSLAFGPASKATGSARAQASAAAKRRVASLQAEAARQVLDFWSGNGTGASALPTPATQAPSPSLRVAPPARKAQSEVKAMKVLLSSDPQVHGGRLVANHVATVVRAALARFGDRVARVEAHLADGNGQADGARDGVQCTLHASLARLDPVVVRAHADHAHLAIHGAVAKLKRAVGSALAKHDPRYRAALIEPETADPSGPPA